MLYILLITQLSPTRGKYYGDKCHLFFNFFLEKNLLQIALFNCRPLTVNNNCILAISHSVKFFMHFPLFIDDYSAEIAVLSVLEKDLSHYASFGRYIMIKFVFNNQMSDRKNTIKAFCRVKMVVLNKYVITD